MKRIFLSLTLIVAATSAVFGSTTAFFSDTETSTANVFTAGAVDLKIDNESYYNGNKCAYFDEGINDQPAGYYWQGTANYPIPGTPCATSWQPDDLDKGLLFFNFTDLKPDDEGEDTISLRVENDAWVCMDLTLTANDDESSNEPELGDGDTADVPSDSWDGELAQNIQMLWWADDGDTVYEVGEPLLSGGVKSLLTLAPQNGSFSVPLADSINNAWGQAGPLPANTTKYIAKAWCLGSLTPAPVTNNGGVSPAINPGVLCDGTLLDNRTQSDTATLDIRFRAVQARHNSDFRCSVPPQELTTLTLVKVVVNNDLGSAEATDWTLSADGPGSSDISGVTGLVAVTDAVVEPGTYTLAESNGPTGYTASTWSCVVNDAVPVEGDMVTLAAGDTAVCTITNTYVPQTGTLTVVKSVSTGPLAGQEEAFSFQVNGGSATAFESDGTNVLTLSPGQYSVTETAVTNYTPSYANSANANTNCTNLSVIVGENVTCTITNTYVPPTPTEIINEDFGVGSCSQDVPGWDEDAGESCTNGTVVKNTTDQPQPESPSPTGGRFALLSGNNGYICRSVNATGLKDLQLKYYWRGDVDASDGETGSVRYFTTGTCSTPGPTTVLVSHELDDGNNNVDEPWSTEQSINLPTSLNNSTFFIRFTADSNSGNDSFRIDGVKLIGTAI